MLPDDPPAMSLARRVARDHRLRFLLVGAANTALGYAVFVVLVTVVFASWEYGYLWSLLGSYALSISVAFFLYRRWVFPVTGQAGLDFVRFVAVNLVAVAVNAGGLTLLVETARMHPVVGQVIMLMITVLLSYFGHRLFSFRRQPPSASGNP